MATKKIYVHVDHQAQEIQNVSLEKLTTAAIAALGGADLFEGRIVYDTDKNQLVHYDGAAWRTMVNSSELNKFGALIGTHSVADGIPDGTTATEIGSGVDELGVALTTAASLQKGDFWIIDTAGVLVGIQGNDTLTIGDLLMCTVDGSTAAADWIGIQMNINDLSLGINNWIASTVYEADVVLTAVSPTTGHRTIYRRIAAGTSGLTFDATEEALHLALSTVGLVKSFADDTTVAPASAGEPTLAEIKVFALANNTLDTIMYYTGDDTSTNTPTYVYWVDTAGDAVVIVEPGSTDLISDWAATTAYVINQEVTAVSAINGHRTLYRRTAAGTSGAAFNIAEEGSWTAISSLGTTEHHADDTTVSPASAGNPTIAEIETYVAIAGTVFIDGLLYYTGDDLPASTPTYVYWIDSAGSAVKLSGGSEGVFAATKTAALVANTPLSFAAEMAATVPTAMTVVRSVQVIEVATGEDITSGVRIDWTAFEVEANVAITSVTITILGE